MISVSATTAMTDGNVIFPDYHNEGLKDLSYKIETIENTDGTICLANYGQNNRVFTISIELTQDKEAIFRAMVSTSNVIVSCSDGVFYGAVSTLKISGATLNFTFMVQSKDSE